MIAGSTLMQTSLAFHRGNTFNRQCEGGDNAMNEFLQGFIKGAKETPKGFFAPAIAIWRLLVGVSESLTKDKQRHHA